MIYLLLILGIELALFVVLTIANRGTPKEIKLNGKNQYFNTGFEPSKKSHE